MTNRIEYVSTTASTHMKGMLVKNYFLHGLEIEKARRLNMYMKLVNRKMMLFSGVDNRKSSSSTYLASLISCPPLFR